MALHPAIRNKHTTTKDPLIKATTEARRLRTNTTGRHTSKGLTHHPVLRALTATNNSLCTISSNLRLATMIEAMEA